MLCKSLLPYSSIRTRPVLCREGVSTPHSPLVVHYQVVNSVAEKFLLLIHRPWSLSIRRLPGVDNIISHLTYVRGPSSFYSKVILESITCSLESIRVILCFILILEGLRETVFSLLSESTCTCVERFMYSLPVRMLKHLCDVRNTSEGFEFLP